MIIRALIAFSLFGWSAAGKNNLTLAVHTANRPALEKQITKGVDINATDKEGFTALFYAVSLGEDDMALLLINKGADLEKIYGTKKENLLFEAARLGRLKIIHAVLARQPGLAKQKNTVGKTPADEAKTAAQSAAAQILSVK